MNQQKLNLISENIKILGQLDAGLSIFGARSHHWKINPPIDKESLRKIESSLGYHLPSTYREYIIEIGNGGAGPYFGVRKLQPDLEGDRLERMRREFIGIDEILRRVREVGIEIDEDGYYEIFDNLLVDEFLSGTWYLAPDGCGHSERLVLHGKEAGSVFSLGNEGGIYSEKIDFLDWMLAWLNKYRSQYKSVLDSIYAKEKAEDFITWTNCRVVISLCGKIIPEYNYQGSELALAKELYQSFLRGEIEIPRNKNN